MKNIIIRSLLFFFALAASAQEVKLKKDVVYVDGSPTFSYNKKAMGNELYINKLNSSEEIVSINVDNNKTESKVDDSKRINFNKFTTVISSKEFRGKSFEDILKLLLSEKVINLNGEVDAGNLKRFWSKFDQNNINHTNRY